MNALSQAPQPVRTTCPYCGVGCGVLAKSDGAGGVVAAGDPDHPANFGRLCSKGSALGETLSLEGRLLQPMLRGNDGACSQVSWSAALDHSASELSRVIGRHGPGAVAFYLSGQLLTEDYYVANKLMKGFIGSAHVDTNSRLCMASSVAGHRRAFGSDTVPGTYEDLDLADLIVLVGSNAAWCHPILYQRIERNKRERGAKIVVIDPRRTATAEEADLFLPIAPGMDSALFAGLLVHLADSGLVNEDYVGRHVNGLAEALSGARRLAGSVTQTAAATGLLPGAVEHFFELFRETARVVTCFSQGVNQSAQGTDKVTSIINCHLATGRIGRPGMGPFSLTGQPNAMGGREVGGLANQLAAHMAYTPEDIDRVGRFWRAPNMAQREGLKAVQMFEAIERGEIKALWVMATNPVVSLPRAGALAAALKKLELFIVSDNTLSTDTLNAGAHVLLPAAAWGEKDGTVTNSERRMSRQRPFLPQPGEAKPDWWIVSEVARRMGFGDAFAYRSAADIFREHAALSAFENHGSRDFDIGAFAAIGDDAYDSLAPTQWPAPAGGAPAARFFADGRFFTSDRKAQMIAPRPPLPARPLSVEYPLRLNTGRIRDQWHTMTRSGLSPRLAVHSPEPFVEVNPDDAAAFGLEDAGFARVSSLFGSAVLRVVIAPGQRRGSVFAPIHWSHETSSHGRIGDVVAPDTDPYSGQPEAKATPVSIAPVRFRYSGFTLSQTPPSLPDGTWWARVAVSGGHGLLFATDAGIETWHEVAGCSPDEADGVAEYIDRERGLYRMARFADGGLEAALFVAPVEIAPRWDTVKALFEADSISDAQRRAVLSGRPADDLPDTGPTVCACFGVGLHTIRDAILTGAAADVDEIGKALRAGTNCGSCRPEIKKIISNELLAKAG